MATRRSECLLAAVTLGLLLAQPWAPAAQERQTPQQPLRQIELAKGTIAPAAQHSGNAKFLNPFTGYSEAIADGRKLFQQTGCEACHGPSGEGHMCPAVNDEVWKFGGDDETLFKLIKGEYPGQTMPAVFGRVLTDEQIWKILAWIRSVYRGDPGLIVWEVPSNGGAAGRARSSSRQQTAR